MKENNKYKRLYLISLHSFLETYVDDPLLTTINITKVELSYDFGLFNVYFDTFETSKLDEILKRLQKLSPSIRTHLSRRVPTRNTPQVVFKYDDSFDKGQEIEKIIKNAKK